MSECDAGARLDRVVKAYDVRGTVPDALDPSLVGALGVAFAQAVVLPEQGAEGRVVVGHDMRDSGESLVAAFVSGVTAAGVDVVQVGLCSTDELYFASGSLEAAGAMFTASHNPAGWNGIKLCRPGAKPVGHDMGLRATRDRAEEILKGAPVISARVGVVKSLDVLADYALRLRTLVPLEGIRPLRVVVDAGSGMAGHTVPAVLSDAAGLGALPLELTPMYFDLDGDFPHHEANPLDPLNTRDLQREVVRLGADIGLAFDGDADRCFVVDERGERVNPSAITSLVGLRESTRVGQGSSPAVVLYNAITSRAVPEILGAAGVRTVRTRVGHSFIKALMASEGAIFGGEHSGHFYFRDFYGADSGMLAAMHMLAVLGAQDAPLSTIVAKYDPYATSGEINVEVDDVPAAEARVLDALEVEPRGTLEIDHFDGMTISHWDESPRWWVNLRPSNTEPLLRVNVEAEDAALVERMSSVVLGAVDASAHGRDGS